MKVTAISIIIAAIIVGGFLVIVGANRDNLAVDGNNVTVVGGEQIIKIRARGGYQPRKSVAKASLPTVLRFDTNGTFDCSASVRIPSLNISKLLPQTGSTDIDIGSQPVATLRGTCGMGMYPFEIEFQS